MNEQLVTIKLSNGREKTFLNEDAARRYALVNGLEIQEIRAIESVDKQIQDYFNGLKGYITEQLDSFGSFEKAEKRLR